MAPTARFELRIDEDLLERVDEWASKQPSRPNRSEAVRRLVETGLSTASTGVVRISDGERILMAMLAATFDKLKIDRHSFDAELVTEAIHGGHDWALKFAMPGLFHDHVDHPRDVKYVAEVLSMWTSIEIAYEHLDAKAKTRIRDANGGQAPRFRGFDANDQSGHYGIATCFVETLGRFKHFADRDLNSHGFGDDYRPMIEAHGLILRRPHRAGQDFGEEELIALLSRGS